MKGVIFDIDGVLAESFARVEKYLWKKKPDWESFYTDQRYDLPIEPSFFIMDAFHRAGYRIALITGRPEAYRRDTTEWLEKLGAGYHVLWMREDGDFRPPQEAKREQLHELQRRGWEIEVAFEDHPETVEMYIDEGIMTYITPHFFSWERGESGREPEKPTTAEINEEAEKSYHDYLGETGIVTEVDPSTLLAIARKDVSHKRTKHPHSETNID
jgi:hypothetical protein